MAGLAAEEGGELFLELQVVGARAVGEPGAGRAGAPSWQRRPAGLDHLRVEGQAEVVVARQHDHVAAVEPDGRALLGLHGMVERAYFSRILVE